MHPKANARNYLWACVVRFHQIPKEEYVRELPFRPYRFIGENRLSSQHWDIIHHVHYYITKFWGFYPDYELDDTIQKLEGTRNWRGEFLHQYHPWSPWFCGYRDWSDRRWAKTQRKWWIGTYHDRRSKYQKKPHHKKKELTLEEIRRREWREKKKGKKHRREKGASCTPPKDYKKQEHRRRRRWEKQRLKAGDWDLEKGWRKRLTEPYDWC